MAQSTEAAEYTGCISAEGYDALKCPGFDTKQSDGEAPIMLERWGMRTIPLLSSLSCPLLLGVVAPERVLSMGQIEVFYI